MLGFRPATELKASLQLLSKLSGPGTGSAPAFGKDRLLDFTASHGSLNLGAVDLIRCNDGSIVAKSSRKRDHRRARHSLRGGILSSLRRVKRVGEVAPTPPMSIAPLDEPLPQEDWSVAAWVNFVLGSHQVSSVRPFERQRDPQRMKIRSELWMHLRLMFHVAKVREIGRQ